MTAIAITDEVQRSQDGSAMVPMAVRQNDGLDGSEVDVEPRDVLLESPVLGSGIEKNRVL
jgi:hypothetical protein